MNVSIFTTEKKNHVYYCMGMFFVFFFFFLLLLFFFCNVHPNNMQGHYTIKYKEVLNLSLLLAHVNEPVHEKTNNLGSNPTQTGLYSHRSLKFQI